MSMWMQTNFKLLCIFCVAISIGGCSNPPTLLLSGDSIAHGYGIDNLGLCEVTNIAKGGAGVHDASESVSAFNGDKTSAIIIAIGVNDAKRRVLPNNFFDDWSNKYINLVNEAKGKSSHVYLSTILPVEENIEPYGNYANNELIGKLNLIIRGIAKASQVSLIDSNIQFSQMTKFTVDGVHLNPDGYTHLKRIWNTEIAECRQ